MINKVSKLKNCHYIKVKIRCCVLLKNGCILLRVLALLILLVVFIRVLV